MRKLINKLVRKRKAKEVLHYHSGRYKFYFPYTAFHSIPDENDFITIYTCQVEIIVGQEHDMKEGYIATVIISSENKGVGITNFYEDIATKIRWCFFDTIFYERLNSRKNQLLRNIRWIEYYSKEFAPSLFPNGSWLEVEMEWDEFRSRYHSPDWKNYNGYYSKVTEIDVIDNGKIYEVEMSLSDFPRLGNTIKALALEVYPDSKRVVMLPISSNYNIEYTHRLPLIQVQDNDFNIDCNNIFRFDKLRNVNFNLVKKELGTLRKKKLDEVIEYWKTLNISERELAGFVPYRKALIKGEYIELEENRINEFKSVSSQNPARAISDSVDSYICAYLNSSGGKIFYGINDNGIVSGVKLLREHKDTLRKQINTKIHQIEPHIDPTSIVFYFHNIIDSNKCPINDLYVVEFIVPPTYEKKIYFTGKKEAWIKNDGVKQSLKGTALVDYIKRSL